MILPSVASWTVGSTSPEHVGVLRLAEIRQSTPVTIRSLAVCLAPFRLSGRRTKTRRSCEVGKRVMLCDLRRMYIFEQTA